MSRSLSNLVTQGSGTKTFNLSHLRVEDSKFMDEYRSVLAIFNQSATFEDGTLTVGGLYNVLSQLNPSITQKNVQLLFNDIDKSGTGSVSCEEFFWYLWDLDTAVDASLHDEILRSPVVVQIGHCQSNTSAIESWTASSVTVSDRGEKFRYSFPMVVMGPEASQHEAVNATITSFVDELTFKSCNIVLLVYGGSYDAEAETLFGQREFLKSNVCQGQWGILPSVVDTVIRRFKAVAEVEGQSSDGVATKFALTASVVEFAGNECFDLLSERAPLHSDEEGTPYGTHFLPITQVADLCGIMDQVDAIAKESNRHREFRLTLHQSGIDTMGAYGAKGVRIGQKTTFSVVSLAKCQSGSDDPVASELETFVKEIKSAGERRKLKKLYRSPSKGITKLINFLCNCLKGNAHLGLVVCLSQEPEHVRQCVFSCNLGDSISQVELPIRKRKIQPVNDMVEAARRFAEKSQKALDSTPKQGGPKSKFWPLRKAQATSAFAELQILLSIS